MAHAPLAPSAAERWIACPASVRMSEGDDWEDSKYAQEGTLAHELGYLKASLMFRKIGAREYSERYPVWAQSAAGFDIDEIHAHTDSYVEFLKELAGDDFTAIFLEQRVNTGLPMCWGTSDAIILLPERLHVVDLKYGMGVQVAAKDNPQLRLYGVGALETSDPLLSDNPDVYMTIYQPRLESVDTDWVTAAELRQWRDGILPIAQEALTPTARFGPSDKTCRWCPVRGTCRARIEVMTAQDFGPTDHLSPEEMGELLKRIPGIKQWCIDVSDAALNAIYTEGKEIPGWKVVQSNGRRTVEDQHHAVQVLIDYGYTAEQVADFRLRKFADLDRLVGKDKLKEVLGDLLYMKPGSLSLVEETDNRPSINPNTEAQKEFSA